MRKPLTIVIGTAALLALAGCNSNKGGADAAASENATASDTDVGMGGALASDSAMSGAPNDMAPMDTETGTATMRGPGTGAPSPEVTTAPTTGPTP